MPKGEKPRLVRVAMIKAESEWGDVKANIKLFEELIGPLAGKGVDVVMTPECFLDGYMVRERKKCTVKKLAARCVRGETDPLLRRARAAAKQLGSYLVFGASEKGGDGVIRNAAYLSDRQGKPVGTYYKTHPCHFYTPGDELPVFETDFGTVGVVICADRRWPENTRCLRLKGAEIILNPTWGWYGDGNTAIMRTRAYENGIPVCFAHPQQALICTAAGGVGAILESNCPGVLVHDIDLNENVKPKVTKDRAGSHPVQNRRPELYGPIVSREHT